MSDEMRRAPGETTAPRDMDPHAKIKYPTVYRGLRKLGYSKEKAAKIANSGPAGWSKGGRNSHRGSEHGKPTKVGP